MKGRMLPAASQGLHARNLIICTLIEYGLSPGEINRLNKSDIRYGAVLIIQGRREPYALELSGSAPRTLFDWQVLRPRCSPRSVALILALRGQSKGNRLSVNAIKRIAMQADSKPLNIRFGEFVETSKREDNTPRLRVIQGGR